MSMLEEGKTEQEIAEYFGVSVDALQIARRRHRVPAIKDIHWSASDVAHAMGIKCQKTVIRWIKQGYLTCLGRTGDAPGSVWIIRREDVESFMEKPEYWSLWDPNDIRDEFLKAIAQRLRSRQDDCYLSPPDAAQLLCVSVSTIYRWIREGSLTSVIICGRRHAIPRTACLTFMRAGEQRQRLASTLIQKLQLRGFTRREIALLLGKKPSYQDYLRKVADGRYWPSVNFVRRLELLCEMTNHLPEGDEPAYGRRTRHPFFFELLTQSRQVVAPIGDRRSTMHHRRRFPTTMVMEEEVCQDREGNGASHSMNTRSEATSLLAHVSGSNA